MKKIRSVIFAMAAVAAIVLIGTSGGSQRVRADDDREEAIVQWGLAIAPVPLNMAGKHRDLVGLGSYIVNAVSDCNSCHNSGQPPDFDYAPGRNPYMLIPGTNMNQPKQVNPATYLGGGQVFGTVDFGPPGPDDPLIISRNLTPDKTGLPEGGHTFEEFVQIIRTGVDMDHLHPTCAPGVINAGCVPPPFDGDLLQIMPWFNFQDMTDHDLRAIYEYLSTIPCVAGPPAPDPRHNDCQ